MALSDVSLQLPDGSFLVLSVPTGVGKNTTLRLVAGLETSDTDLRVELKPIQESMGATVLYVTHDQIEVMTITDPHTSLKLGDSLAIRPQQPFWFDASGNRHAGENS